jgi:hypothetical protein
MTDERKSLPSGAFYAATAIPSSSAIRTSSNIDDPAATPEETALALVVAWLLC